MVVTMKYEICVYAAVTGCNAVFTKAISQIYNLKLRSQMVLVMAEQPRRNGTRAGKIPVSNYCKEKNNKSGDLSPQ